MRTYIGGHQAVSDIDFVELALGTPIELWLGVDGEPTEECTPCKNRAQGDRLCVTCGERAARLDAARDILAENPGFPDDAIRVAAQAIEEHAPDLFNVVPLKRPAVRRNRIRKGAAA
ncbi:hypothetical protein ACFYWS_07335 [Streptomyces sp. NPDC002795]|uniref:hypothetical protein n=1 Tax=Streptomyces sp. NPDC002795 TaxID=3364665 RepID=UPI003688CF45